MNKVLIGAVNGPIKVIITPDKLNKDNFYSDINRNIRIKKNSEVLIPDMYVRILIFSFQFSDYDDKILVIGYLQDIANDSEIEFYKKESSLLNDNN